MEGKGGVVERRSGEEIIGRGIRSYKGRNVIIEYEKG